MLSVMHEIWRAAQCAQVTMFATGLSVMMNSHVTCCRVLDTALHDLQALMTQAQAMVDLAEQFCLQLARQPPEPGSQEVGTR